MRERVLFIPSTDRERDADVATRLQWVLDTHGLLQCIEPRDMVAIKTHFGEAGSDGYVRPVYLKAIGELVGQRQASAFLTETSTLYRHRRANAVDHILLACEHGFTVQDTGLPIIMADGLYGNEEFEVAVPGRIYTAVKVAALMARVQGLIAVSHFTGHMGTGFGATLKNLGMGLTSRRAKLIQHSTAKPSVRDENCLGCGDCVPLCPQDAIDIEPEAQVARINAHACIGCGECLAICRFDALGFNWATPYVELQQKVVEHALGVARCCPEKSLYINFLKKITKDCDCLAGHEPIVPDIGILLSRDPVAIDAASLDLVERAAHRRMSDLAYDVPYRVQIDYARDIGFGNPDYELVEVPGRG